MEEVVCELKNVTKVYKNFTLDNVSFSLKKGRVAGFIGENGSGKSTTIKSICDLISINSGEIILFNKKINEITRDDREKYSVVLDELCFPDQLKIKSLKKLVLNIFPFIEPETLNYYFKKYNLDDNKKVRELSKGMKAKVNIAIALARKPELLILDEPTNGLDPMFRDEFLEEVRLYVKENNAAVLMSSHIISDLEKIADDFIFIHNGKIVLSDTHESILKNYFVVKTDSLNSLSVEEKNHVYKYRKIFDTVELLVDSDYPNLDKNNKGNIEEVLLLLTRGDTL